MNDKNQELLIRYRETLALAKGADPELAELAAEELVQLEQQLTPPDKEGARSVILEVRPGAGGDEAELFASELLRAYSRYGELNNWRVEPLQIDLTELGGLKIGVVGIKGPDVYSHLRYESGVHRVQRVPKTEKNGRIHTSTATVAVMPEATPVEIRLNPTDLKMDFYRSGGKGGQNVNKVSTAVRLTHLPTGLVVACQEERTQLKNRDRAEAILRARLYEMELERQQSSLSSERKSQVGTGDRSEKIRTYNFPQDRITDHRLNESWSRIEYVLEGNLNPIVDALREAERKRRLDEILQAV